MEAAALALHAEDVLLNRRLGANGAPLLRQIIKPRKTYYPLNLSVLWNFGSVERPDPKGLSSGTVSAPRSRITLCM